MYICTNKKNKEMNTNVIMLFALLPSNGKDKAKEVITNELGMTPEEFDKAIMFGSFEIDQVNRVVEILQNLINQNDDQWKITTL